jgi:small subunit ribosomal protein S1
MDTRSNEDLAVEMEMDFATLLEESFKRKMPEPGDIVSGTVLAMDAQGLLVDIGMKTDGLVLRNDIERLGEDTDFELGDEIQVLITRREDPEGNRIVSVSQAVQAKDWTLAEELMEADEVWEGVVAEANRGGLIVPFGNLRGFIPASHIVDLPRGLPEDERRQHMQEKTSQSISVKIIEVNRKRRRLVLSEREAVLEKRANLKEEIMAEIKEGEVRTGVISGLRDFGAFVDLGGADGLIHISELAWHRIQHPREVVSVGDKVEVYILSLDHEGMRIGLSLKRLQENPWTTVEENYHIGQLVCGTVTRVAQFGAFIRMEPGIEALLHSSQISNPSPDDVTSLFEVGQELLLRIISIEADRQRLGLSYKEVAESERQRWAEEGERSVESLAIDFERLDSVESEEDEPDLVDEDNAVDHVDEEEAVIEELSDSADNTEKAVVS